MEEKKKPVSERVKDMTTINFSITKCPHRVYEDFSTFCKEETNDNYSMGLRDLLNARKVNLKEVVLYQSCMEIKDELVILRGELAELRENLDEGVKTPKTFGKRKE